MTREKNTIAPRNRIYSYRYFLNINGERTVVCQKCFKATLGENDRFLKTVISKKNESTGTVIGQDLRGRKASTRKISEERKNEVLTHINSFPAYESHYSRKHTSKKYLEADLNLTTMYKLYAAENLQPVSLSKYSGIFHTLGLKFKKPQLDTCTTCDELKIKISGAVAEDLENLKRQQKCHQENADLAYATKKQDIALSSNTNLVFTFDLQQCLPTPFLKSSVAYYKRKLNTYNLTVHDCGSGKHKNKHI